MLMYLDVAHAPHAPSVFAIFTTIADPTAGLTTFAAKPPASGAWTSKALGPWVFLGYWRYRVEE